MEVANKNDFIELKFSGYAQGELFDSNILEDIVKINPKAVPQKTIVAVGQGMVVSGLDKALEGKEIGKTYEITVSVKEGFGERRRELVKTIPLKVFTEREIMPRPGMSVTLDDMLARIIAVSGARVVTDFNNPLAGKELNYKFTILRKVTDEKEKCEAVFSVMFKFMPEFEVGEHITVKGPKVLEVFVNAFKEKFKEMIGKELKFELKEEKKTETDEEATGKMAEQVKAL